MINGDPWIAVVVLQHARGISRWQPAHYRSFAGRF
jgi:hypothetical protein